jgi:predicted RNA-binding protein with PUA-like domain
MKHWLVKSEPSTYAWEDLVRDKRTHWDGVRNAQARNNLAAMKKGDLALVYHSGDDKQVIGVARVVREAFPDTTAEDDGWVAVDLEAVEPLAKPVTLAQIKAHPELRDMALVRQSRLSVMPLSAKEFRTVIAMSKKRARGRPL